MNKVICNICGTSYPENASQCPICGFSRSSDSELTADANTDAVYTHVKGGRYSKANVKKRNKAVQQSVVKPQSVEPMSTKESKGKSSAGMVIIVILLLLAIIAVVGYIALRFFLPNDFLFEGLDNLSLPVISQDESVSTEPSFEPEIEYEEPIETTVPAVCTGIFFEESDIQVESVGSTFTLDVYIEPEDTVDTLSFSSDNENVATVNSFGVVTITGEGTAVITATCGDIKAQCHVTCTIPSTEPEGEKLVLNRKEITFEEEGQSWLLYDGDIPAEDITWSSDDNTIATIEAGTVTAVGNGSTTVYGFYNDESVVCIIHCDFENETTNDNGGISEAGGDARRTYKLYNPNGYSDDVTLKVGESFTLMLVDENKNEIKDAQWEIESKKVCSYKDHTVTALKSGTTEIRATYEGSTYTCVVRVK